MNDLNAYVILTGVLLMVGMIVWAILADQGRGSERHTSKNKRKNSKRARPTPASTRRRH